MMPLRFLSDSTGPWPVVTDEPNRVRQVIRQLVDDAGPIHHSVRDGEWDRRRSSWYQLAEVRAQARIFSTSALKDAFGREPLNWWKTSPSRTTAKVGMERTP